MALKYLTQAKYAWRSFFFAYGGSCLCRLGSGELWCIVVLVGGLRFVYPLSGVCMHAGWDVIGVYRALGSVLTCEVGVKVDC